jgi:Anti-sigma-K factor rskA, C-terminal
MSEDVDLERVERMLRRTPAPTTVPEGFEDAARKAALGEPPAITQGRAHAPLRARRRPPPWWRMAAAVAALGAAAAAAVALAIGSHGGGFTTQYTLSLTGQAGARAAVDLGPASGGVRQMQISVHGLRPAGPGHYYEMWFRSGGENVSAITFDTAANGSANFRAVIPAGMSWRDCWITRETTGSDAASATVLHT